MKRFQLFVASSLFFLVWMVYGYGESDWDVGDGCVKGSSMEELKKANMDMNLDRIYPETTSTASEIRTPMEYSDEPVRGGYSNNMGDIGENRDTGFY